MNEWRMGDLEIHRLIRFKMDGSMDGSMNRALDGWMDELEMDGWMDGWIVESELVVWIKGWMNGRWMDE